MTSQTEQQITTMYVVPSISRSQGNHTAKFGQLIEHNMRNIFLEKLYTKYVEKLVPNPFTKNQN